METTSLCLNTRLLVKINFQILILFIEINVNVCLLCDHHLMKGIILHTRKPTCQLKVSYALGFSVSADFYFAFWGAEMHVIHIVPFRPTMYVPKRFRYLKVSYLLRNWDNIENIIYVGSKLQLCQLEIPIFIYKLMYKCSLITTVSFVFCQFNRVASWNEAKLLF